MENNEKWEPRLSEGVRVKRLDLLETLKRNRNQHRDLFIKALEGWQVSVQEALSKASEEAMQGKKFRTHFDLPQPEDHTSDYDRVITMLEMSVDDLIILEGREAAWYIMDDWGWKGQWTNTVSAYTTMRAPNF